MKAAETKAMICGTDFSENDDKAAAVSDALAVLQTSRRPVLIVWPPMAWPPIGELTRHHFEMKPATFTRCR